MTNTKNNKADYSPEVTNFISRRPSFLIRWGMLIFLGVLLVIIGGTFVIQYPEIVYARARVTSINPPTEIIAKTRGRIAKLLVHDGSVVHKNSIIGYCENTADHKQVLLLAKELALLEDLFNKNKIDAIPAYFEPLINSFHNLGDVQTGFQSFIQSYLTFKNYIQDGLFIQKRRMLQDDLNINKQLRDILNEQKTLQEQDFSLFMQNYKVQDTLHTESLINETEFRSQKSLLIGKQMGLPQMKTAIVGNISQENSYKKDIVEVDNQISQQKIIFIQSLTAFKNIIDRWIMDNIISAPVDGIFTFSEFLLENQLVQAGQLIGFVTDKQNTFYVQLLISQNNLGKIKSGQEVLLQFPSYPSNEFGTVKGVIQQVKSIPSDSGFLATAFLPKGLVTDRNKQMQYSQGLIADAQIITEKMKLSDRLLGKMLRKR